MLLHNLMSVSLTLKDKLEFQKVRRLTPLPGLPETCATATARNSDFDLTDRGVLLSIFLHKPICYLSIVHRFKHAITSAILVDG